MFKFSATFDDKQKPRRPSSIVGAKKKLKEIKERKRKGKKTRDGERVGGWVGKGKKRFNPKENDPPKKEKGSRRGRT